MGVLERMADVRAKGLKSWSEPPFWDLDRMRYPFLGSSSLNGNEERIETDFEGYVEGIYKRNGPVAALMFVRLMVFSEARFQFRRMNNGRPGDLFGTGDLDLLERPWTGATTGDLLSRMIVHADLAGNAYLTVVDGRVRLLRPDWVSIVSGSDSRPDLNGTALAAAMPDAKVIAYIYAPRLAGATTGRGLIPGEMPDDPGVTVYTAKQVAHFAPLPDPVANWRGMSWLTPTLREVTADSAATRHKLKFFENGATPQLAVRLDASVTPDQFKKFKQVMDAEHGGVDQAYKTLYLGGGADVTPLTVDLKQLDFKVTQGAGESRLAAAAGVPPVIVGFSEGLAGSSLNAGNYSSSRRRFADGTLRPLWRNAAGSLATLIAVPDGAELWYDDRDIAFLREDAADQAAIMKEHMLTIESGVRGGFKPESVVAAVVSGDLTQLQHTGLYSVQLQPPVTGQPSAVEPPPNGPASNGQPALNGSGG
jgi:hypothetical protein